MNADPRVSVVMSVYNDAGRVEHAVSGVLSQSFRDLEIVVINDGSSDNSGGLLDRLAVVDPRLRVIHQQRTGLTRALIRGCSEARGEFIARQDSDDWSHPLRIDEQVALLDSDSRIGLVSCATEYLGPSDEHLLTIFRSADPEIATREMLEDRQGPPAHGSVMFRKSLYQQVGGYRSEFYFSQDSDLWLRMAEHQWIGYVPEVRYRHRKDARSISGAQRVQQSQFARLAHDSRSARLSQSSDQHCLDAAAGLCAEMVRHRGQEALRPATAEVEINYLIGSQLACNGDARARRYLWDVIRVRPWHVRAWVRLLQSVFRSRTARGAP